MTQKVELSTIIFRKQDKESYQTRVFIRVDILRLLCSCEWKKLTVNATRLWQEKNQGQENRIPNSLRLIHTYAEFTCLVQGQTTDL